MLARLRALGHHERGDLELEDARLGLERVERAAGARALDDAHRRIRLAQLEQAAERVQRVGELVLLRAQGLGHPLRASQVAQGGVELGAVAQDEHGAHRAAVDDHRVGPRHEHALTDEHELLLTGVGQQRLQLRLCHLGDRHAGEVVTLAPEQPQRRVVAERDRAVLVEHDEPLADAVQRGVAGLEHRLDLVGLDAVDAPSHERRGPGREHDAEHGRGREAHPEHPDVVEPVGAHLGFEDADRDLSEQ